jgi:hypothetical protein
LSFFSTSDLRYPAIRLAKNGSHYPPQAYTTDITLGRLTFNGVPDVNRISLEYGNGATISLPLLHRTWTLLGSSRRRGEIRASPGPAALSRRRECRNRELAAADTAQTAVRGCTQQRPTDDLHLAGGPDTQALLTFARALQSIGFLHVERAWNNFDRRSVGASLALCVTGGVGAGCRRRHATSSRKVGQIEVGAAGGGAGRKQTQYNDS